MQGSEGADVDGIDGSPIETFGHAAIVLNGFVLQGRIGVMNPADSEAAALLLHLGRLVETYEEMVKQGMYDSPLN